MRRIAIALVVAACHRAPAVSEGPAASLALVSGSGQSGIVGQELPDAIVVRATDGRGVPVQGQLINFHVTAGGGSVFAGASITNAAGIAQDRWTLGTSTRDTQAVEARAVDSNNGRAIVFATFTATPLPDAVARLASNGDGQAMVPGGTLLSPISAIASDQYGNPVPGITVTWTTADGQAAAPTSVTDEHGIASMTWTLGSTPGAQSMQASCAGLAATLTAYARVPAHVAFGNAVPGYPMYGAPGQPLPNVPTVAVTDAANAPVPGATVTLQVTAGGGSVALTSVTTNEDGFAAFGDWTLGPASGLQELTATVEGSPGATLEALADLSIPNLTPTILNPGAPWNSDSPEQPVGQQIIVVAKAGPNAQSVTASVNGTTIPLTYGPSPVDQIHIYYDVWSGTLDMGSGPPPGRYGLVVAAADGNGSVATRSMIVDLDRPPVVTMTSPADQQVVRNGSVDLDATCTDDGPAGCTITGYLNDVAVQPASASTLHKSIDVSSHNGQMIVIDAIATDSAGHQAGITRDVWVESSTVLSVVADVGGNVLDVSGSRVLSDGASGLRITDVGASSTETLDTATDVTAGHLMSAGAIYQRSGGVYESRTGTVSFLGSTSWMLRARTHSCAGTRPSCCAISTRLPARRSRAARSGSTAESPRTATWSTSAGPATRSTAGALASIRSSATTRTTSFDLSPTASTSSTSTLATASS